MKITVILCTRNRSRSLAKALDGAARLHLPEALDWDVLVVDNGSSDDTREVVLAYRDRYAGRFRYLFEPQPGKSHALNAGLREAGSRILAFLDDDVTVEPDWLHRLTASLHDGRWAGAGGRVVPEWAAPPPPWLPQGFPYGLAPLVSFDLGPEAGPLTEPPFGTNMAFRKEVFEKHGGFRTDLGPRPGSQIRGEDTELGQRLLDAGERLRYEPSAVVHHPVAEERLRKAYFRAWWFDKGRSRVRDSGAPGGAGHRVAGIPLSLLRGVVSCSLRWAGATGRARRFHRETVFWAKLGELVESRRQAVSARKPPAAPPSRPE